MQFGCDEVLGVNGLGLHFNERLATHNSNPNTVKQTRPGFHVSETYHSLGAQTNH
jgi:hypothetical protein